MDNSSNGVETVNCITHSKMNNSSNGAETLILSFLAELKNTFEQFQKQAAEEKNKMNEENTKQKDDIMKLFNLFFIAFYTKYIINNKNIFLIYF